MTPSPVPPPPSAADGTDDVLELESPVHDAFGLTYASYYVMPRVVLQAMPVAWQRAWVALAEQIHDTFDFAVVGGDSWEVQKRDERGRFIRDPLRNYRPPRCRTARRDAAGPCWRWRVTSTPRQSPAERCDELCTDVRYLVVRLVEIAFRARLTVDAETLRRMQKRLAGLVGLVADVGQGDGA